MVNLLWKKVQPVKVTKLTFDLLVKVYLLHICMGLVYLIIASISIFIIYIVVLHTGVEPQPSSG